MGRKTFWWAFAGILLTLSTTFLDPESAKEFVTYAQQEIGVMMTVGQQLIERNK